MASKYPQGKTVPSMGTFAQSGASSSKKLSSKEDYDALSLEHSAVGSHRFAEASPCRFFCFCEKRSSRLWPTELHFFISEQGFPQNLGSDTTLMSWPPATR
jgi:hypothetical protein